MAKAETKEKAAKPAKPAKDLGALKKQLEAILHSNGFDGAAVSGQIIEAVAAYTGEDLGSDEEEAA